MRSSTAAEVPHVHAHGPPTSHADVVSTSSDTSPSTPDPSALPVAPTVCARARAAVLEIPLDAVEVLLARQPRIVGFGVYIWNVSQTTALIAALKRVRPDLAIVLGGPEVSFEVEQQEIFQTVQKLLKLRHQHPALTSGKLVHLFSDDSSYIFVRQSGEEKVLVVFNNAKASRTITVPILDTPAQGTSSASPLYGPAKATAAPGSLSIDAPPQSLSILSID